ncbi:MAG: rRNA pseudouridine synthase [Desulfovibrio sp.]|nr:rRNA pseudouridine synthase [Desulfovibrio sp.]
MRLNKAIAERGYCSRRKADERILAGAVTVNGKPVINPGERVSPDAEIIVDGISLSQKEVPCYLLLNKPVHTLSTAYDPEGRPTVLDLVPEKYRKYRLYPVGRLDYFSEGLILLTNDGSLTNALLHPRYHLPKTYHVTVRGFVSPKDLQTMQSGMTLPDGQVLLPVEVHARSEGKTTLLSMTLYQGINRQIRKMCDALHITILRLVRIAEGPLSLGDLPSGTLRELSSQEVRRLKKAAGVAKTEKRTAG